MIFVPDNWIPSKRELEGKTVLVTGANDGIGRAVAKASASCGAEVLLLARREELLTEVYDEITTSGCKTPAIIPLDLMSHDYANYSLLAQELSEAGIKLDGLVHNAAILGELKPLAQTSVQIWHQVLQVNITSIFMLTRALLPLLEAAPAASIILTSSAVGRRAKAYWGAYAVSKFAVEGFMQVLCAETRETSMIRVNSLDPGAVNTKMRRKAYPAEALGTNPWPSQITNPWIYLLSDVSKQLSGQALTVQI